LRNVADLTSRRYFQSKDEPDQWVFWYFHELRVRPTHYTILAYLKYWIVEGSIDGEHWREIDRQTEIDVNGVRSTSVAVSDDSQFRFIRFTQLRQNVRWNNLLPIDGFEVFGTLIE
jgi:hypothetical protein